MQKQKPKPTPRGQDRRGFFQWPWLRERRSGRDRRTNKNAQPFRDLKGTT
jgi:hypothetical protein